MKFSDMMGKGPSEAATEVVADSETEVQPAPPANTGTATAVQFSGNRSEMDAVLTELEQYAAAPDRDPGTADEPPAAPVAQETDPAPAAPVEMEAPTAELVPAFVPVPPAPPAPSAFAPPPPPSADVAAPPPAPTPVEVVPTDDIAGSGVLDQPSITDIMTELRPSVPEPSISGDDPDRWLGSLNIVDDDLLPS